MKLFTAAELEELKARFGAFPHHCVTLEVGAEDGEAWEPMQARKNRRGEVVLVLQLTPGQVLLHTKSFYPEGIYRLPTGGIKAGEKVLDALHREALEETGLEVEVERFLGLVEYRFLRGEESTQFASWIFQVQPLSPGLPQNQDPDEQISDFRSVPVEALNQVAAELRQMPPAWRDWGLFRAVAHDLAAEALNTTRS